MKGQVRLLLGPSSGRWSLISRDQTCRAAPSPCVMCFLSISLWPERTKPARTKVVFSIIATGVKAVNITQNQQEKGRTALGQVWGEETGPVLLSAIPGGYRNPLTSALRTQQAETRGPNQGSSTPGAGSGDCVGLTPSTWVRILYPETPNLLFTCSVSCSR